MKILVITGGNSSERDISFLSAKNVAKALINLDNRVELFDLRNGSQRLKRELINTT